MAALDPEFGTYGGKVLRRFSTTVDGSIQTLLPGVRLSAEVTASWPLRNRLALKTAGKVEFAKPSEDDEVVPAAKLVKAGADCAEIVGESVAERRQRRATAKNAESLMA